MPPIGNFNWKGQGAILEYFNQFSDGPCANLSGNGHENDVAEKSHVYDVEVDDLDMRYILTLPLTTSWLLKKLLCFNQHLIIFTLLFQRHEKNTAVMSQTH